MIYGEDYNGPTDPAEHRLWKQQMYMLHYGMKPGQLEQLLETANMDYLRYRQRRRKRISGFAILSLIAGAVIFVLLHLNPGS